MLKAIATLIFCFLFAFTVNSQAPDGWMLDVTGFGTTVSYSLTVDAEGRAYVRLSDLVLALRLGKQETETGVMLGWGGRRVRLQEGSLNFGERTLTAPIINSGNELAFPLRDLDAFGVKLSIEESARKASVIVPRATIKTMGISNKAGPTLFLIQLSHSPQSIMSFLLSAPDRLVLDIGETIVDPVKSIDVTSAEVTKIRASMNRPGVTRVVLELTKQGSGAYVYQDPHDPSLIRISYPGTIKSLVNSEKAGMSGFQMISNKQFGNIEAMVQGGIAKIAFPDQLPDKAMKLKGDGYSITTSHYPWTNVELNVGMKALGEPIIDGMVAFFPLVNRMTDARIVMRGSIAVEIDFAEAIALPKLESADNVISIYIPALKLDIPQGTSVIEANGVGMVASTTEASGVMLKISGMDATSSALSLENEGRRLVVSSGGGVDTLGVFNDNGVKRLTFGFKGSIQAPQLVRNDDGKYAVEFAGIGAVSEKVSKVDLGRAIEMEWVKNKDGVKCILKLADGLVAVQRNSQDQNAFIVDIGYRVEAYNLESSNGTTKITIKASGPVNAQVFRLREPDRLVVDMPGFVEGPQRSEDVSVGGIKKVRAGQNTIGVARLVFDLDRYIGHTWQPTEGVQGVEIVIAEKLLGLFGRLILIDPGHGGKDGGAVGNSIIEKNINLDIALKLRSLLEEQGAVVVMTRSSDVKVELLERSGMANLLLPDAIICIHSNSVISPTPNGTETFYFGNEELSRELASAVHKSIVDRIGLANRGLFKKEYHIIKETFSPSVLIEVGFLSNKQDAAMLSDDAFRTKAAVGIFDGLVSYFSGTSHDKWAFMKERLNLSMMVPHYEKPTLSWPGLYLELPWTEEAPIIIAPVPEQAENGPMN